MQKEPSSRSAFFTLRVTLTLLLCAAACSIVTGIPLRARLAFLRSETPAKISTPVAGLSFAERVAYQRAIEDVYWRHRIWPRNRGERPDPKPSLDAVMSQTQLEKKVADYLRKSQALEDYWQRPLTAEQLQAETDRMAQHTKQPEVLRELFEAPGERSLCHRGGDEITKTGPERRTTSNSHDASCCRWRYRPEANAMAATPQMTPRIH